MKKQSTKTVDVIDEVLEQIEGEVEASPVSEEPGVRMVGGYPVPANAQRVRVITEKGRIAWRRIEEVVATDTIELSPRGEPQWMKGELGRPKNSSLHEELPPKNEIVGDLIRVKNAMLRTDPVVLAAESTPDGAVVLDQVLAELAVESASMKFERQEAERNGKETSSLSMRRVVALKAIGDTFLKRKEVIQNQAIDLDSPEFQKIFSFFSETFTRAMIAAGIRQEAMDSALSNFSKLLDEDWKNEARNRMKSED